MAYSHPYGCTPGYTVLDGLRQFTQEVYSPHLVEVEELYMTWHKKRAGGAHAYTILDGLQPSTHINVLFYNS